MRHGRRGFTLVEAMMVVAIMGSLVLFSMPKFAALQERSRLTSARQEIEAAIATARAAAVQKGRTATLNVSSNKIWVTVANANGVGQTTIIPSMPFDSVYGLFVETNAPSITFDMRGFLSPRLATKGWYRLVGTSRTDSVCITAAGQIMSRGCSL